MTKPEKTQTIRVNGEVHKLIKKKAVELGMQLQECVQYIIKKECEKK